MHVRLEHINFVQVKQHAWLEIVIREKQSHTDLSSAFKSEYIYAMVGLSSKCVLALEHTLHCPFFVLYL